MKYITLAIMTVALVALFAGGLSAAESKTQLSIGDGTDWQCVSSTWADQPDGSIKATKTDDGDGLQGYCLAFLKNKVYSDLEAEFDVTMPVGHADEGFIIRAQDPTHYYLVHFPQCGQGYRAQHYWAALSKADGSGYLRIIAMNLVTRVASNPLGTTNHARIKVTGDRIQVWVNGFPAIDERDKSYKSGRIGLGGFMTFAHGKVMVSGKTAKAAAWNDKIKQVKNWFTPFSTPGGAQSGITLVKTAKGTLLCQFISGTAYGTDGKPYLARSSDLGKTWTVDLAPANVSGMIQSLKDGRLVSVRLGATDSAFSESTDDGLTWSAPVAIDMAKPPNLRNFALGWPLQLKDGTLIMFGYGTHESSTAPITKWGAVHLQGFATRSTDGGKTWSKPANLDTDRPDMGNLDLTEPVGFETADGRIMCLIRPVYSPWMWETWSKDGGKTWGPCVRGPFPGWAPSAAVKTESGAAIFPTRGPGLTMHTTRDDGMTWDANYIDTSIWAMGSLVEVKPNVVLFMYMDSWWGLLRGQYMRITPKGLEPIEPDKI